MIRSSDRRRPPNSRRWMLLAVPAAAASLVALAACSSSGNSSGNSSSGNQHTPAAGSLKTRHVGKATVLTSNKGFTLYSFAPDTATKSTCNGACAAQWPPQKGPVAASGIKGTFTTITRSDGSKQEAFNGHPLYTFAGDKAPGETNGNGLNAFGGLWHEVTVSGTAGPATGGGGY
ncbi:MAG TPA: hypothetical protein VGI58_11375 [Streptosporangiaceae bacterium]